MYKKDLALLYTLRYSVFNKEQYMKDLKIVIQAILITGANVLGFCAFLALALLAHGHPVF